jgi:hypothetical protein
MRNKMGILTEMVRTQMEKVKAEDRERELQIKMETAWREKPLLLEKIEKLEILRARMEMEMESLQTERRTNQLQMIVEQNKQMENLNSKPKEMPTITTEPVKPTPA